ncbi:hypothetical protein [Bifidobacterium callitrichidarum]|uniref:Uncharacterized protein n=1 Tax=Bifidobacterium callitrichidarum TaxID=2052941 RepID=A0A2U2NBZ1_9BIFI|nr:hypothetical protein [Bifidobacterium callitrichidarum]PWG66642.1 hypothetical protein DF196_01705 [Bifidobacterium callitrichidarum]
MIGLSKQDSVMTPQEWDQYNRTVGNLHHLLDQMDDTIRLKKLSNPDVLNAQLPVNNRYTAPQTYAYQPQQPAPTYQPTPAARPASQYSYRQTRSTSSAPTTQFPAYQPPASKPRQQANPLGMQLPPSQPMPEFHPTLPTYQAPTRVEPSYQTSSSGTPSAPFGF